MDFMRSIISYLSSSGSFRVNSSPFQFVPVRGSSFWSVLVRSGPFWFLLARSSPCRFILVRSGPIRSVPPFGNFTAVVIVMLTPPAAVQLEQQVEDQVRSAVADSHVNIAKRAAKQNFGVKLFVILDYSTYQL